MGISKTRIEEHLRAIAVDIGVRPIGSSANAATYDYINQVVTNTKVVSSTFESVIEHSMSTSWNCKDATSQVAILPGTSSPSLDITNASVMPFVYSTAEDFAKNPPTPGSIAVVALGTTHESQLCMLAHPAAAIAWFREGHSGLYSGNCKRPDTAPLVAGFAIDESTAKSWISQSTLVTAQITVERNPVSLRSIICDFTSDTAGSIATGPMPCFIAHYDSKPMTPGANDNASGVAVLLSMIETWPTNRPARFIFFDGEEVGVQGSTAYVKDLLATNRLDEISCVICPDSVGLGELHLYTADKHGPFPEPFLQHARKAFVEHDWELPERIARSGGSDYMPFHLQNVPSLFLSDFPNHVRHTTVDTVEHIDFEVLTKLATVLIETEWQ